MIVGDVGHQRRRLLLRFASTVHADEHRGNDEQHAQETGDADQDVLVFEHLQEFLLGASTDLQIGEIVAENRTAVETDLHDGGECRLVEIVGFDVEPDFAVGHGEPAVVVRLVGLQGAIETELVADQRDPLWP